jgi:heme/copper-type cytochrome/quinol oxidase subunit 1
MKRGTEARLDSLPRREASFIEPMESALVSKLPEGPDWTYEVKLDGYRAIGVKTVYPAEFQVLTVMSSAGASILGFGYLIPFVYLLWSIGYGPVAGSNPWGAKGLECETPSPPPTDNFEKTPITQEPYGYAEREPAHV